jgi:NAD(P)-dependent dehydrogenase (short-subunit alcohol dehydrogenase family)
MRRGSRVDVTDREGVAAALKKVRQEFGPIGIVVTSTGIDENAPVADITAEAWLGC